MGNLVCQLLGVAIEAIFGVPGLRESATSLYQWFFLAELHKPSPNTKIYPATLYPLCIPSPCTAHSYVFEHGEIMDSSAMTAATLSQTSATTSLGYSSQNAQAPASAHTPCSCRRGVGIYPTLSPSGSFLSVPRSFHRHPNAKQSPTDLRVTILPAIEVSLCGSRRGGEAHTGLSSK